MQLKETNGECKALGDVKDISVLHVIPNFYPATKWGGPVFSTKAICDGVAGSAGVDIKVFTTDAAGPDLHDTLPLDSRTVSMPEGYTATYFKRVLAYAISPGLMAALPKAIRAADIVHLTSAYSSPVLPTLALAKAIGRPVVWSPRGAIQAADEWTGAPRKKLKRLFETVARNIAPADTVLHVTATSEAEATQRRMPGLRTAIIPNSVKTPPLCVIAERAWRPEGRFRLVFLSRVHQKKGLEPLLDSLVRLPSSVELDIYGTGEEGYVTKLEEKVRELGVAERVRFCGHVDGESKTAAFLEADLFVLPSYSENFGIVVAEALAHGVPVLTTNSTPWGQLAENGCGDCISLDVNELTGAIEKLGRSDLKAMGLKGRAWMEKQFSQDKAGADMLQLYRDMVGARRSCQEFRGA